MNTILLLRLLSAHLLADFFLQNDKLCKAKTEDGRKAVIAQLTHALIHAVCAYILLADWQNWIILSVIFISHFIVDVVKSRLHGNGTIAFQTIVKLARVPRRTYSVIFISFALFKSPKRNTDFAANKNLTASILLVMTNVRISTRSIYPIHSPARGIPCACILFDGVQFLMNLLMRTDAGFVIRR